MDRQMPKTYFTTEFRGGKRAVKARMRNLLTFEKKRRGLALLIVLVLAVSLCGGLVACNGKAATVEAIAEQVTGKDRIYKDLQQEFSTPDPIENGTICVYSMDVLRKAAETDTPAGGAYIDDEGWYHEGRRTYLVLAQNGEKYTLVTSFDIMIEIGNILERTAQHLLSLDSEKYGDTAYKLIARSFLPAADQAMAYFLAQAPTDESRTDENGVEWKRFTEFTKYNPELRIDDQILSIMWYIFPKDIGTDLFNRYVYHPGGIFEEYDNMLWVRADAADILGWDYTVDWDTLTIVSGSPSRVEFTLEGTDHGQPKTWTFVVESSMANYWQVTKYFTLSSEGGDTTNVSIDYGNSKLYSNQDIDGAIAVIKETFGTFNGCVLNSLTYAGDEVSKENLAYCNTLANDANFTECIVFNSSFQSPKDGGGAWEADTEYTWAWYLAKEADGNWTLLTYGY